MLKRAIDIVGSAFGLIILAPVLLVVALTVWSTMGAPVFYRQSRPGRHHKPFTLLKFRTMSNTRDSTGALLDDGQRLTRVGKFLRASSLDELPELWNVLKGEMSLVGPRPLLFQYLGRYTERQDRRHDVRPGLTGWAQVNGRNAISWEDRFELDVWYVDNRSILLDLKIIALTVKHLLRPHGINAADSPTMSEFLGTRGSQESNNLGETQSP
jgi:sugar transferase EpsL